MNGTPRGTARPLYPATILEQVQGVRADMIDVKARLQRLELAVVDLEQAVTSLRKDA